MSLVSRYGPGAEIPPGPTEVREVEQSSPPADPAKVRAMFAGLGWSTTPPAASPVVDVPPAPAVSLERSPYNPVTGAEYRGGNILRLLSAEVKHGYGTGGWAGFQQWITVGRVVRKGEHGTACIAVIGGMRDEGTETTASTGRRGVRGFRVFHYDQTVELGEVSE